MSLQVRLDVSRIQREEDDTIFVAQLSLQSVRQLDSGELTLAVERPRALFPSHIRIGDPVVFYGRVEEILDRRCDPDDPAGICRGAC